MRDAIVIALIGLTSLGAWVVGTWWLGLAVGGLRTAAGRVLECAGLTVIFLFLNLGLGVLGVVGLRALSGRFVSFYIFPLFILTILSTLQALLFAWWWRGGVTRPSAR
jgi:hypothetical protein